MIGVQPTVGPPLPSQLTSKDSAGKTVTVLVHQAKPANILIHSAKLVLADAQGNVFATPNTSVTLTPPGAAVSQAASQTGPTPNLTINIQGQVQKP